MVAKAVGATMLKMVVHGMQKIRFYRISIAEMNYAYDATHGRTFLLLIQQALIEKIVLAQHFVESEQPLSSLTGKTAMAFGDIG
jgi:hypothetical protein